MLQLPVFLPLAQLSTPGGSSTAPASPAAVPAAPAAPAAAPVATGVASVAGPETTTAPGGTATSTTSRPAEPGFLGGFGPILIMATILGALYFFMTRGQRKEEKRRKDMLSELKKGDRIMTIGGMLASVVSVDDDKVVLKIDESNNVKATYRKSAIQEVIDRDEKK